MKIPHLFSAVLISLLTSSCAHDPYANGKPHLAYANYERYEPSLVEMARIRRAREVGIQPWNVPSYNVSDRDVVDYADHIKAIFRTKFTNARFARYSSSTLQVLLAGGAGVSAAFSGGATATAALAFASAATPQIGGIFNARDRAILYQDAAAQIDLEESMFLEKVKGRPSKDTLTRDGAAFYRVVIITIEHVENVMAGKLPELKSASEAEAEWKKQSAKK